MMSSFSFNQDKGIAATLFILEGLNGKSDFHKIFKTLYFADREHLATYGRPIVGDWYAAMPNGPVPSNIYNMVKSVREGNKSDYFNVVGRYFLESTAKPHTEHLSESDIQCLLNAIENTKNKTFSQLTTESHDGAWSNADENGEILYTDIAKEAGANEELLKFISTGIENDRIEFL